MSRTNNERPLRYLITAGPTREYFDAVRFLSNASSGKMGYALAEAAAERGGSVDLVSGPVCLSAPDGVTLHGVVSCEEMHQACLRIFPDCDLLIMCAAVSDYRPATRLQGKMKKDENFSTLELTPTVDILRDLAGKKGNRMCVGFAAETENLENYARDKLNRKNLDWIVANDISRPGLGMDSDKNEVVMFSTAGSVRAFGPALKKEVAAFILDQLALP
ncbi:MAG: phosphopantothenoylcysteine decarboxylase [Opitutales bacterium]